MSILSDRNQLIVEAIEIHSTATEPLRRVSNACEVVEYADSVEELKDLAYLANEVLHRYDTTESSKFWVNQEIIRIEGLIEANTSPEPRYRASGGYNPNQVDITIKMTKEEYDYVANLCETHDIPQEFSFMMTMPAFWPADGIDESTSQCTFQEKNMLTTRKHDIVILGDGAMTADNKHTSIFCSPCTAGITEMLVREVLNLFADADLGVTDVEEFNDADGDPTMVFIHTNLPWQDYSLMSIERQLALQSHRKDK